MAHKRARIGKKQYAWVKWVVALCVLAVLGVVFVASVGVGRWLLRTAEKYPAEQQAPTVTVPEQEILPVGVPDIKAHSYVLGDRYSGFLYAGVSHLCAPLRAQDGTLAFASDVCERMSWDANGATDLAQNVTDLHQNGLYLSAYIPISGFSESDAAMRELTLSYEAALITQAAKAGVDEIFLTGLAPTQANIADIAQYLRRVKSLAGDTAIGVLIEPQVLLAGRNDAYTAAQLLTVCDFLVLDVRGLTLHTPVPTPDAPDQSEGQQEKQPLYIAYLFENAQYELIRYAPRIAFDAEQTDALDYVISKGYGNWVIMGSEAENIEE